MLVPAMYAAFSYRVKVQQPQPVQFVGNELSRVCVSALCRTHLMTGARASASIRDRRRRFIGTGTPRAYVSVNDTLRSSMATGWAFAGLSVSSQSPASLVTAVRHIDQHSQRGLVDSVHYDICLGYNVAAQALGDMSLESLA